MLLDHASEARQPLLAIHAVATPGSPIPAALSSSWSSAEPGAAATPVRHAADVESPWARSWCSDSPLEKSQFRSPPPHSPASDTSTCPSTPDEEKQQVKRKLELPISRELQGCDFLPSPERPTVRAAFWVVLPAFSAYASLFALQHEVKTVYGIPDNGSAASHQFSAITSLLYLFSLAFRFLHNVVFGFLESRHRVYLAIVILISSMSILILVTTAVLPAELSYLAAAYALGGVGMGTFESNLVSCLTGLGDNTKKFATVAIPVGVCLVQVGGFFLLQLGMAVYHIYAAVIFGLVCGATTFNILVPRPTIQAPCRRSGGPEGHDEDAAATSSLMTHFREWRLWLPQMWSLPFVMAVDLFYLSVFSPGVMLFIYDQATVALASPPFVQNEVVIPTDIFFVVYNMCLAVGGFTGRCFAYNINKIIHPAWFTILHAVGASLILLGTPGQCLGAIGPALAPLAALFISLGDGLVYNTICRTVDMKVPKAHNLAAVSLWFFIGDWGAVIGSNLIPYIHDWIVS